MSRHALRARSPMVPVGVLLERHGRMARVPAQPQGPPTGKVPASPLRRAVECAPIRWPWFDADDPPTVPGFTVPELEAMLRGDVIFPAAPGRGSDAFPGLGPG